MSYARTKETETDEEFTYRCQSCRASYESGTWSALPVLADVPDTEVRTMVEDWPSGLVVRVRRCACGQSMARKERAVGGLVPAVR